MTKKLIGLCLLLWVGIPLLHCAEQADLIVFSYNRPMQLYALLESVEKRMTGIRKVGVVCRIDSDYEENYQIVRKRFCNYHFVQQSISNPRGDFKTHVMELLFGAFGKGAEYALFAVDDIIVTEEIDIPEGIEKLKEVGAFGLYYRLGKNVDVCGISNSYQGIPALTDAGNEYFSWNMATGNNDWEYPYTVDLTLYPKAHFENEFRALGFTYPNDLEGGWNLSGTRARNGLCCKKSKMINIPMNIVQNFGWGNPFNNSHTAKELNDLFSKGWKIDIDDFYHIQNNACHVNYMPKFITREIL